MQMVTGSGSRNSRPPFARRTQPPKAPLLDPTTDPARIRAFFVHPEFARRGIGSRILRACMDAARAAGFRRFSLAATLPGVPLYQAFGFEERERFEIPLPDGLALPVVQMERNAR